MIDVCMESQGSHKSDDINMLLGLMSCNNEGAQFAAWFIAQMFPTLIWC